MKSFLNISGGELFNILFVKIISLDFKELKVTFHLSAQVDILSKSLFNLFAVSVGSIPLAKETAIISKYQNITLQFFYNIINVNNK